MASRAATARKRPDRGPARRALRIVLIVLLAIPLVPVNLAGLIVDGPDALTDTAAALTTNRLTIDLYADRVSVAGGSGGELLHPKGDVLWRNRSGDSLTVTSPSGLLDSGPIPDGGSFHASLPLPGEYVWESDVGAGAITVVGDLVGGPTERALDGIPDLPPPAPNPADISLHPDLAVELPRSLAVIGFTETATVQQATAALGNYWEVVGGLPTLGLLYVRHSSSPTSFASLDAELARWRTNVAVEFASYVFPPDDLALPEPVGAPISGPGPTSWTWEPPDVADVGAGGNWGQELVRAPHAWNLLDAAAYEAVEGRSATVVLDSGFATHLDLERLEVFEPCVAVPGDQRCATNVPADHGTEVAGIVGADRSTPGVNGIDPWSRLYGLTWRGGPAVQRAAVDKDGKPIQKTVYEGVHGDAAALELLLRALKDGTLEDVAVLNLSIGLSPAKPADWWGAHADDTCGPGPDDDDSGTGTCYPSNHDETIEAYAGYGMVTRRAVERFVTELADPPLFVGATGNYSMNYCRDKTLTCRNDEYPDTEPQGILGSGYNWASHNWDDAIGENPIIAVEAIGYSALAAAQERPSLERAGYSNIDGDVSAPGWTISTCGVAGPANSYCLGRGTSLAAPVVSGLAGMLASWDPTLSAAQLKARIIEWSVADTTRDAAPRVDAYNPLLSIPGVAEALVDVNDPSNDGNRRVAYDRSGLVASVDTTSSTTPGDSTEPDGVVDLLDFRRFRDAWLARCQVEPEVGCPTQISLDGAPDHPKRDLNLDGEVLLTAPAQGQAIPSELTFSRFDYNGDGVISVSAATAVALRPDGSPAAAAGEATDMTDLDVLQSQWDPASDDPFGVTADELRGLLSSGDLTIVADGLAPTGDDEAELTLIDHAADEVVGAYGIQVNQTAESDNPVVSVPAGRPHRIEVSASGPGGTCEMTVGPFSVKAGEDRRVDLDAGLSVYVDPQALRPDSPGTVRVSGASCFGDVTGTTVDLTLAPSLADGASFTSGTLATQVTLDADGTATAELDSGSPRTTYDVTAEADLPVASSQFVASTATAGFSAGEFYELEVAAVDGTGSGFAAVDEFFDPGVPLGPSVNADGDVAFGGLPDGGDRYHLFVSEPGDDPTVVDEADDLSGSALPADARITGEPQLNDAGEAAFSSIESSGNDLVTRVFTSSGTATELATGVSTLGSTAQRFATVERPTINSSGRALFVATPQSGSQVLAEKQGALVVEGPATAFARPRLADDDTSVVQATVSRSCQDYPGVCGPAATQILDPILLVGEGLQTTRAVVAEGRVDGWGSLSDPDISGPGDAIAFAGDRDDKRGLWLAVRRADGSYQVPIAISGPAAAGSDLTEVDLDRPTVTQIPRAPSGPAGDRVLVAFRGTGSGAGSPAANAAYVVGVDLVATQDATIPFFPRVGSADLVAQVGDVVDGRSIASLQLGDSLAVASAGEFPDDHWVAFFARTPDGDSMYVRGRALPPPTAPEPASAIGAPTGTGLLAGMVGWAVGLGQQVATALASLGPAGAPAVVAADPADPADLVVLPMPHVAAVTVLDDTPTSRVPTTVVNRSRAIDGTPAWAVLDDPGGDTDVLSNPVLLEPDAETSISYPASGSQTLSMGAPLSAGENANDVSFTAAIAKGENRPPVAAISDSPYLAAPGSPVGIRATATDPDGDRVSYTWDLDGDGEFDDADRSAVTLTPEQVQGVVCSGACTLEVPYPIAVRALDERGLEDVARSTITVSGLDDIVIRLEPALTQINPGSTGSLYAIVDAPTGSPAVTVDLSTEGVPDGWSVSAPRDVDIGESAQLTVRVPDTAPEGSFSFDLVATAGDVEKRATISVVTLFGLIPECTTTITGRVTDENGAPLAGAVVDVSLSTAGDAVTDANGLFTVPGRYGGLPVLRKGFEVERFSWTAAKSNRTPPTYGLATGGPLYAECDGTTALNPVLAEVPGTEGLTARAVVGIENPVNPTRPLATDVPLADVSFRARYQPNLFKVEVDRTTSSDGRVTFLDIPVQTDSERDMTVGLTYGKAGYWGSTRSTRLSEADAGKLVDLGDVPLPPACTGTFTGGSVVDQFGEPVAGAGIRLSLSDPFEYSEEDGSFTLDREVFLGTYNRPRNITVRASAPAEWGNGSGDTTSARLGSCGGTTRPVTLVLERPEPDPVEYVGTILGSITDAETGEPIPRSDVSVRSTDGRRVVSESSGTRADGSWGPFELVLGEDEPDVVRSLRVTASADDYFPRTVDVELAAGGEVRVDAELEPRQLVTLTGTVTDAETGEPVDDAQLYIQRGDNSSVGDRSDPDGTYALPDLLLGDGDGPRETPVYSDFNHLAANQRPYWRTQATTTLVPDGANTLDLQMVPVCDRFGVSGVVVNAATLEPLEDVRVLVGGGRAYTDAQGRYEIVDLLVDTNNEPREVTVSASKTGFFTASVDIVGFCGANIVVDFGTPANGFGAVSGTVTDGDSGDPLPDVFVGSEWGDATTTGPDGTYSFDRAPLGTDGHPREWTIAARSGFTQVEKSVTVAADVGAVADFAFTATANEAPEADDQTLPVDAGAPAEVVLTGRDPEDQPVTFRVVDGPSHGSLSGTAPTLRYTSDAEHVGPDSFTFVVNDGTSDSEPATVTLDVRAAQNGPPVARLAPVGALVEGDAVVFDAGASSDPEGGALSFAWSLVASGGETVATGSGASWRYVVDDDFVGVVRVVVADAQGAEDAAEADVVVGNVAPQVSVDSVAGPGGAGSALVVGDRVSVAGSFSDVGSADTHVGSIDWGDGSPESAPAAGGVVSGEHVFAAAGGFSVVVQVCDDDGGCTTATEQVTVQSPPVDDRAPRADDQTLDADTGEPVDVLLTGYDPDGADVSFRVVDGPSHGSLSGTAPTLRYTSDAEHVGPDSFTFVVNDGTSDSEPATVSLEVRGTQNAPPEIDVPPAAEVVAGELVRVDVTGSDPDGDDLTFDLADDADGRASLEDKGDGTAVVTFVADVGDAGTSVDVRVRASDGKDSVDGTLRMTIVAAQNGPPVARLAPVGALVEGDAVVFDAGASSDPEGGALSFAWSLVASGGETVATGSGASWRYVVDDDFVGVVRVVVADAQGAEDAAEADVVVGNVAPQVSVDSVAGPGGAGSALVVGDRVSVAGSFSDVGSADTHVGSIDWGDGSPESAPAAGGVVSGEHVFAAAGGFSVVVQVCDDDGGCTTATEQVTVQGARDGDAVDEPVEEPAEEPVEDETGPQPGQDAPASVDQPAPEPRQDDEPAVLAAPPAAPWPSATSAQASDDPEPALAATGASPALALLASTLAGLGALLLLVSRPWRLSARRP